MILDYSQPMGRPKWGCWLKLPFSARARLQVAHTANLAQASAVLLGISVAAAALSTSHRPIHHMMTHLLNGRGSWLAWAQHDGVEALRSVGRFTLHAAPIIFISLAALLALAAVMCKGRLRSRCFVGRFAALCAGCVPIVWFFLLLQLEGVAPLVGDAQAWQVDWNPLTNFVRFTVLLLGVVLAGIWALEMMRMYRSLELAGGRV